MSEPIERCAHCGQALPGSGEQDAFAELAPRSAQGGAQPTASRKNFVPLVLVPLVSYAILATITILVLLLRPQPDPLEFLPDIEGDFKGATRSKPARVTYERVSPDSPVPRHLHVKLGGTVRLGDLEVRPDRVEVRRLVFRKPGFQPEPGEADSLVLYLTLTNRSADTVFCPTDPWFERQWRAGDPAHLRPYMMLSIGTDQFPGGPIVWARTDNARTREQIEGQEHRLLQPGEQIETFVATNPADRLAERSADWSGPIEWRVQLRRGLVRSGSRDLSATGVLAVTFDAAQLPKAAISLLSCDLPPLLP